MASTGARKAAGTGMVVPVPRRWRPSNAGRIVAAGYRSVADPMPVKIELLQGGGSRQVPKTAPLPKGVLTAYNSYDELLRVDEDGRQLVPADAAGNVDGGDNIQPGDEAEGVGAAAAAAAAVNVDVEPGDEAEEAEGAADA